MPVSVSLNENMSISVSVSISVNEYNTVSVRKNELIFLLDRLGLASPALW